MDSLHLDADYGIAAAHFQAQGGPLPTAIARARKRPRASCTVGARGVLKLFVEQELFAPAMLGWLHSGFCVHDGVWLDEDDWGVV